MGAKYPLEITMISHPRDHYRNRNYGRSGLPAAPAIMVGDYLVVQGSDVEESRLEAILLEHLRL